MKNIYITGIAGLLGINLSYYLKTNYNIFGVDIVKLNLPNVISETYDILDREALEKSLVNNKVNIVIHTVAAVDVDNCEVNPTYAEKINANVTKTLAELCYKNNIKMVYISTDAVFNGSSNKLYTEEDETNPINVYGKTKLEGEKYVLSNPINLVLRTNIYGYNIQNKNSFGEWVLYSLLNDKTINMFSDIYFSPILVNEFAEILSIIIQRDLCGLYHLCGTGLISKYQFGIELKRIFGIKTGQIISTSSDGFNFKAKRSKNMGMSNKKLSNELGIHIRTPFESIEYFKRLYDNGYPQILKVMGNENAN